MTKDEILNRLGELLDLHFPDAAGESGPEWNQQSYKDDLFDLAIEAVDLVFGDQVQGFVSGPWSIHRRHPVSDLQETSLERLISAWREWQYAFKKMQNPLI